MLEETPELSTSELAEKTLAGLTKLGTQTFALSPFSQYYDDWLVNVRQVVLEFESDSAVAADEAFAKERMQIFTDVERELAEKRLKEAQLEQAAKTLADKENLSNILGGAFSKPTDLSKDPNLNQILLDLRQNDTMRDSFQFAETLLKDIKAINPLKYPSYRQANFIVLKAPDIPSVLVEMAYITNKEDERLLNREEFQGKIAKTLTTSIKKTFKP